MKSDIITEEEEGKGQSQIITNAKETLSNNHQYIRHNTKDSEVDKSAKKGETERQTQTQTDTDRQTETDKDRETETERDRDREIQRETETERELEHENMNTHSSVRSFWAYLTASICYTTQREREREGGALRSIVCASCSNIIKIRM